MECVRPLPGLFARSAPIVEGPRKLTFPSPIAEEILIGSRPISPMTRLFAVLLPIIETLMCPWIVLRLPSSATREATHRAFVPRLHTRRAQQFMAGPILAPPKQTKLGPYRARFLPVSNGVHEATLIILVPCLIEARQRVLVNVALTPPGCLGRRVVHLFRQIPDPAWLQWLQQLRPRTT